FKAKLKWPNPSLAKGLTFSRFGVRPWSEARGSRVVSSWSENNATLAPGIGALAPARPAKTVPNGSATTTAALVFAETALAATIFATLISPIDPGALLPNLALKVTRKIGRAHV